jgi:predicted nucleic acid-binding protein
MTGKFFLDTNFLVYCFSATEPEKQAKCLEILRLHGRKQQTFVISTQVVNEFINVMLGKFKKQPSDVTSLVTGLNVFEIIKTDMPIITEAISIHAMYQLSFWDSLIVSAAKSAHCTAILTEDMGDGSTISGINILNPFTLIL